MSTSPETAAFDGFLLALRLMYQIYDIEEPAAAFEKPWAALKAIAEGRVTVANPADLAAKYPEMADFLYERANLVVEDDRRTAIRVLKGMQEGLGTGPDDLGGLGGS